MKKNLLITLFALMAVALNGNAQDNTYNMVIEMTNGTKITIGPNDIKNIIFNDGELIVTGEEVNNLVEQQSKVTEDIAKLSRDGKDMQAQIATLQDALNRLQAQIQDNDDLTDLAAQIKAIQADVKDLEANIAVLNAEGQNNKALLQEQIAQMRSEMQANIAQTQANVKALQTQTDKNDGEIKALKDEMEANDAQIQADVKALQAQVYANDDDLMNRIAVIEENLMIQITDLQYQIYTIKEMLDSLRQ